MTKPISYQTTFTDLEALKSQIQNVLDKEERLYDYEVDMFFADTYSYPLSPLQTLFQTDWSECFLPERGDELTSRDFIETRDNYLEYSQSASGEYIFTIRDDGQTGYVFQEEFDYLSKVLGSLGVSQE